MSHHNLSGCFQSSGSQVNSPGLSPSLTSYQCNTCILSYGVHRFENSFHPSTKSTAVQIDPEILSGMMYEKNPSDDSVVDSSEDGESVWNRENVYELDFAY